MKTEQTPELVKHMLKELEAPARELTLWESQFVDRMHEWEGKLTDKQFAILERIYAEKTA